MSINEADQTYSLSSRTNKDNLMQFSLFSFLQQRTFNFIMKNYRNIKVCCVFSLESPHRDNSNE